MSSQDSAVDQHAMLFQEMVFMYQMGAMQSLGKIMNPITGKVERDLNAAKHAIDVLAMLESRTEGNLTEPEERLLKHSLTELRMNYVDEQANPTPLPEEEDETTADEENATEDDIVADTDAETDTDTPHAEEPE